MWNKVIKVNIVVKLFFLLAKISSLQPLELLTDDEGDNPYLFIYLKPGGFPSTVGVDTEAYNDRDELKVDEFQK